MNTSSSTDGGDNATVLEKYGHVMSYLQYENSVYWQRGNFFMIASTALFGFMASNLAPLGASPRWEKILALLVVSVAGGTLSVLWHRSLLAAEYWIDHWHEVLRELEPQAFGDTHLFRTPPPDKGGPRRIRMRRITEHTLVLFYILWGMALAYSFVAMGLKAYGRT